MYILGVSALYHDAAAAIIKDGQVIAAAQEERFTRIKHDPSIPKNAITYCMQEVGIVAEDLEAVVYYDDPILILDRFLANMASSKEAAETILERSFDDLVGRKMWIAEYLRNCIGGLGKRDKLLVARHHLSHAASAYYPSPFRRAAILTLDGVGEWDTTTIGLGEENRIKLLLNIDFPHSLGLLYSAFTYFCGFRVNYGDYKLMGLAPYGQPVYYDLILEHLIDVKPDGSFRLNLKYFDFQNGRAMTNEAFERLFNGGRRLPEANITRREMDMAASIQKVVEDVVIKLAEHAKEVTGESENLVMAGGVALNCVANGVLRRKGIFKNIYVQPASGDAGCALGCALLAYYQTYDKKREVNKESQKGSFLGGAYSVQYIKSFVEKKNLPYHEYKFDDVFYAKIAELLDVQKVIGVFQGRMEFGPRALGHRSIIADPRSEMMQEKLNLSIKYRESFRPFAPSVLTERKQDYFDMNFESPYMLLCAQTKQQMDTDFSVADYLESQQDLIRIINRKRSDIPAVTHVDYSARVQTVDADTNPVFYAIIKAFEKRTGCGVVVNTSFNVRGEPIVCTPEDAYHCFMNTEMDVFVIISETDKCKLQEACELLEEIGFSLGEFNYTGLRVLSYENKKFTKRLADPLLEISDYGKKIGFHIYGEEQPEDFKIMILGGSTSNDGTFRGVCWPKMLYLKLRESGYHVSIYNGAYCGNKVVHELLRLVRDGWGLRIDCVISMSGVNDSCNLYQPNRFILDHLTKNAGQDYGGEFAHGIEIEEDNFDFWLRMEKVMRAVSEVYGAKFLGYLQPMKFGKRDMNLFEESLFNDEHREAFRFREKATYDDFYKNIIDIFDDEENMFIDACHYTEKAKRILADIVYKDLTGILSR